ncbi:hypothetical protein QKW52_25605 [Bacillus sonorensis]|nr:hypothetical protein [Bacillus sonorensis]
MGTLVQEFTDLYCGKELPALNLQYKDFAVWQLERFSGNCTANRKPTGSISLAAAFLY